MHNRCPCQSDPSLGVLEQKGNRTKTTVGTVTWVTRRKRCAVDEHIWQKADQVRIYGWRFRSPPHTRISFKTSIRLWCVENKLSILSFLKTNSFEFFMCRTEFICSKILYVRPLCAAICPCSPRTLSVRYVVHEKNDDDPK